MIQGRTSKGGTWSIAKVYQSNWVILYPIGA